MMCCFLIIRIQTMTTIKIMILQIMIITITETTLRKMMT
nr:MAG TPA: hypothetical protein [Bacteriophage sp.]